MASGRFKRATARARQALPGDWKRPLLSVAAAVPLLIGSAALAKDTLRLGFQNRALQQAADTSAEAAAQAIRLHQPVESAVHDSLAERRRLPLVGQPRVEANRTPSDRGAVRVTLTAQPSLPLMSLMLGAPAIIVAESSVPIPAVPPS